MSTPIRTLLLPTSELRAHVGEGLEAVEKSHRDYIAMGIRSSFTDSIDLDKALERGHEQDNRWDYLLGWGADHVIALEPHSATNHEVKTVIAKKKAAIRQLEAHRNPKRTVLKWFWVASGKNDLTPLDKRLLVLKQNGIDFVAPMLTGKHLPSLAPAEAVKGGAAPARKKAAYRQRR